jgi:hypothetical protein
VSKDRICLRRGLVVEYLQEGVWPDILYPAKPHARAMSIGWRFSGNEGGSTICVNAQAYWKGERWEEAKIRRDEIETHPWGRNNAKEAGADPFDFICGLPVICK